jgi:hypothetical protein
MGDNHVLREIFQKAGVEHEGEMRSQLSSALLTNAQDIEARYQSGRMSHDHALDATRYLVEADLAEATEEGYMDRYIAAHKAGAIDPARRAIGGWNDNISPEAAARRREDAYAAYMLQKADEMFQDNQLAPQEYHWVTQRFDPSSVADARVRTKTNQANESDLDGGLRDLDANEVGNVAAATWAKRAGLTTDLPQSEPDAAPPETGSDWSESKLESFWNQRESGS